MESILWACDLVALVLLCYWAVRQDRAHQQSEKKRSHSLQQDDTANAPTSYSSGN